MSFHVRMPGSMLLSVTATDGLIVECLPGVQGVVGLIPCWVVPNTLKMVLDAFLLSARHLKDKSRKYGSKTVIGWNAISMCL